MTITHFDWSTFIAEVTDIPTDVVFQIVEDGQTMFYTTDIGDKTTNERKIEETTKQAFQIIIDELYTIKSIEDSLQGKSLQEIFDVVNLIERYQMAKLQKSVNVLLSNYPITDDTVLEVAAEAKFLKPKLKDAKSIFKYFKENGDQKEVVGALMILMNDIALMGCTNICPTECSNCGYEDCQDGKEVKDEGFREGLLVTNNRAAQDYPIAGNTLQWADHDYGIGKVTRMDALHVTIENVKGGVISKLYGNYPKTYKGYNLFLFVCN